MHEVAFQAESFQLAMRGKQQRAARSFVAAARLDPDKAILDEVDATDGVAAANLVEQLHQRNRIQLLAVHRDRCSLGKSDGDSLLAIGCVFRRARQLPGGVKWSVGRIFQFAAFMAYVPDVAVT